MPNFTKQAIRRAFFKLLNEHPINKITIKDIVDECGINRNSFYYHFEDIPTLMRESMKEILDGIIASYPKPEQYNDLLQQVVSLIQCNRRAFLNIYNSASRNIFENFLWDTCELCSSVFYDIYLKGRTLKEGDCEVILTFYKSLLYGQLSLWTKNGIHEQGAEKYKRLLELSEGLLSQMVDRSEHNAP